MNILAVNPWIHDFAAHDFWLKPYGFLALLTCLRNKGHSIDYIDCTDKKISRDCYGRGKLASQVITKPETLISVPRRFKRYGITPEEFSGKIASLKPDLIMLTSSMTYWYTGLKEAQQVLCRKFPDVTILIGGTYASLMPGHARACFTSPKVTVITDPVQVSGFTGTQLDKDDIYASLPDYGLFYPELDYVVIRSSWGCPLNCDYCAIKSLSSGFHRLPEKTITGFILSYSEKGMRDFIFYDDALLYPQDEAKRLLENICRLGPGLRFHTPNAMHLRYLDKEMAALLKAAGFINPHFGLETLDPGLQKQWGGKISTSHLKEAVNHLKAAGFDQGGFSLYLLLGFPGQSLKQLKKEIDLLHSLGARISLAEFSPVPGSKLYLDYSDQFPDPLRHNNSAFAFFQDRIDEFYEIKNYVRELNKSFC